MLFMTKEINRIVFQYLVTTIHVQYVFKKRILNQIHHMLPVETVISFGIENVQVNDMGQ